MNLSINTNVAAMSALKNLGKASDNLNRTFGRLSSGLRVQSSSDDAAGLAVATRMSSQIRGLNQGMRNSNDAISMLQVADDAMGQVTDLLQRMRDLASQAASDTYTSTDRDSMQAEIDQLLDEVDRVKTTTLFNTKPLLDGSGEDMDIQVDADGGELLTIATDDLDLSSLTLGYTVTGDNTDTAVAAIEDIDTDLAAVATAQANVGAYQNRFTSAIAHAGSMADALSAARSGIMDADVAVETASLTKNAILQQAGAAILAQANQQPLMILQLLK